ncbi:C4-dicarboxylate ABC transporter substrate-binding protein [Oceanicola sp. 22II-s10i]|uniref:TRAP transporter small permease n=1 Tax=Oceanicola sp. 22II-s10i TaxID=1317116 RepID=UPI000B51F82A|nr:TRAP transporter small permease subunit [Oceanicola sp. 22II-s10i]OWU85911.1 C4-dicarboxylate ABC transporter substrate-binding protein [Oceanicola sp. 22II-s10i]
MKRIEHVLDTVAAIAIVLLCLLISANIVAREVIKTGVPDIIVMVQELMVPAILFPLAGATAARAHIAIEVIANHFPAALNRWIAVLAALIGVTIATVLLLAGWMEFWKTFNSNAHYGGEFFWPKWPGRALFFAAIAFFEIRLLHVLWVDLRAAVTGRPAPETL